MKISAMEEYGLRCLIQVAKGERNVPLSISEVARREGITVDYATKLLTTLRKGGFLRSIRGAQGGYLLSRNPDQIHLAEVMRFLGGPIFETTSCGDYPGTLTQCIHMADCSMRSVLTAVAQHIFEVLERVTLQTLIENEATASAIIDKKVMEV